MPTWGSFWMAQPLWCWGWGCNDRPSPAGGVLPHQTAQWCRALPSCCCLWSDSWSDPPGCWGWAKTDILRPHKSFWFLIKSIFKCVLWVSATYTMHGTPPIRTLTSLGCPVLSLRPLMVREVPPALGPLWGKMPLRTGSWWRRDKGSEAKMHRGGKCVINSPIQGGWFIGKIKVTPGHSASPSAAITINLLVTWDN